MYSLVVKLTKIVCMRMYIVLLLRFAKNEGPVLFDLICCQLNSVILIFILLYCYPSSWKLKQMYSYLCT